ncbi:MAG: cytochrome c [Bacteroidota bacterium]
MKKLKFLSLSVATVFILGVFVACGGGQDAEDTNDQDTDQTEEAVDETTTEEATADFSDGEQIYKDNCMVCHQENGLGVEGTFPPLANSDYLLADKKRAILQTLQGAKEPITINGIEYPGNVMTIVDLEEQQTIDVVNYILNSWGNNGGTVNLDDVKAAKEAM